MSSIAGSSGGVSIVHLDDEVPTIEATPGVEVRHLVGQDLMFRVVDLAATAVLPIDEREQEHVVLVASGTLRITQDARSWDVAVGGSAMVRPGRALTLTAVGGATRCLVASTPPNVDLVRDLLHLEHADHGFD